MSSLIKERVTKHESGLYAALILPISFSFTLTFIGCRLVSHFIPQIFFEPIPGLHVHHFTYGFFILAITSYLALIYNSPRAKFWISLLFGIGLGLAMDEFGMWLHLRDDDPIRWSYDGFNIFIGIVFVLLAFKPGFRLLKALWPFGRSKEATLDS